MTNSIFGVHDPVGLRYLFLLRVRLSPWRSHKSHHNFIDTPSAICQCNQDVEDTSHFLFFCPLYISQRTTLKTSVNEILPHHNLIHFRRSVTIQLYLYGHVSINYVGNRKIIISTVKHIKDTRRFSTYNSLSFCRCGLGCEWTGGCGGKLPFILSLTVLFFVLFVCMCLLYLTILFLVKYSVVNF